jgi:hypothetical protein
VPPPSLPIPSLAVAPSFLPFASNPLESCT